MTPRIGFRRLVRAGTAALFLAAAGLFANAALAQTAPAVPPPAAAPAPPPDLAAAAPVTLPLPDATTQPGGGIVATVNGDPITEDDVQNAYTEFADQLANFDIDQRRDVTVDLLIHIKLIAAQAQKEGIDKEPQMAEMLQLVHDKALYTEYLNRLFSTEVTQDKAQALYDQQQKDAPPAFEYHVAHILVPTADEAKQVIAKLDAGGDFAAIAKDESIDTGTADMGGDLGFIQSGDTVKEFEDAAFALDVGKYTETPVESQYGFHVIKLIEKRPATPKTFDDEASDLQDQLAEAAFNSLLTRIETGVTILKAPDPGAQSQSTVPDAGGAAPALPAAPGAAPAAPAPAPN